VPKPNIGGKLLDRR